MDKRNQNIIKTLSQPLRMLGLLALASLIGYAFGWIGFPQTNIVIVYLLAVHMTAWLTSGFIWGLAASIISTFLFNFFFTTPYLTFAVDDPSYIITFAVMTLTALITSTLTSHAKQSALSARQKEAETKAMYELSNRLTGAGDSGDIESLAASAVSECFSCGAACLRFGNSEEGPAYFIQQVYGGKQLRRKAEDALAIKQGIERLHGDFYRGDEFFDWPIRSRDTLLGVLRIPKKTAQGMRDAQITLLRSMAENVALAMDRFQAAEQRMQSREEALRERYRGNLLRAISHDLRTPLSGIMGTAEMLLDMTGMDDPQHALALEIHKEADWLHTLVENILSLTRLRDGSLAIQKQPEAAEEIIASAVEHAAKRAPEREISVNVPQEVLLVPMDARLIKQVLINLLDNALKHTPPDGEISVSVCKDQAEEQAVFTVADRGAGIRREDLPRVFQMFYTSGSQRSDARQGIGLGLAICDTIIKAHCGRIEAHNRADGPGAAFVFRLPLEDAKHGQTA